MAEPIREDILVATVGRMGSILVANGYRQDVAKVSRRTEKIETQQDFPVILVLPAAAENSKLYEEIGDGIIEAQMGVEIVAMVRVPHDGEDISTVMERLIEDIETAMTTPDLHLGLDPNVVTDVQDTGQFTELYVAGDEQWQRAYCGLLYRVKYEYLRGAA